MLRLWSAAAAAAAMSGGATISSSCSAIFSRSLFTSAIRRHAAPASSNPSFHRFFCVSVAAAPAAAGLDVGAHPLRGTLLERLRSRHLKGDSSKPRQPRVQPASGKKGAEEEKKKKVLLSSSFEDLGLDEEVMSSVRGMGISTPTEIQCLGVTAVLDGKNIVMGSHTGSGKTLAYMLPIVQLLRRDEELFGMRMKPGRPRAVVLCPTRELCEQVFRVAKSIGHHARFRCIMISGGVRSRPQEDSLNQRVDMVVGTPGRILQHINDGNMVYGDIKYLVLDEADTMFDQGFGPDIRKFLGPLKHRAEKTDDQGFQTVLVTATMTKAVQKLIDEEFQGIIHLRTSTFHKKVASARHDFIKLTGSENKLESLTQILEPSLAKGNRVMVFCNTLDSSRAVDHFLRENQIFTVNYHGEVPAGERVENIKKFKSDEGDCPTLVCTDLAARGLDLAVDHVIMFDFPRNSIDYLHRTGRTARMGAKGKVTSLVAKRDVLLASKIEEAIKKNESLEALSTNNLRREAKVQTMYPKMTNPKGTGSKITKLVNPKGRPSKETGKPARKPATPSKLSTKRSVPVKAVAKRYVVVASKPVKAGKKVVVASNPAKKSNASSSSSRDTFKENKQRQRRSGKLDASSRPVGRKISVVGFRGRRSSSGRREDLRTR